MSSNNITARPPIVVVMGHIDHGKSQLLDYVRSANIVSREAGGITQHIGAYEVTTNGHRVTFIDTPGHEAFAKMRERGVRVADIAILVVASDEGVKPQTLEAYKVIKESGIPFIVALNKIDKPNSNPEMVKSQLAENGIVVESYGGQTPSVNISAISGEHVEELLDTVILLAEIAELKADPSAPATGVVIESKLDPKKGVAATLIIQNGSLKRGDFVVAGDAVAPVRILENFEGQAIAEASFSSPIRITGFDKNPGVGETFCAVGSKKEAEEFVSNFLAEKELLKKAYKRAGLKSMNEPSEALVSLIIKADTVGSLEAVEHEILKTAIKGARISFIRSGVGNISEADVKFAQAEKNTALLAGFNVGIDSTAKNLAEQTNVPVVIENIIYKLAEKIQSHATGKAEETERNELTGTAKILRVFSQNKKNQVIGGTVLAGKIAAGKIFVLKRRSEEIGRGKITGLEHAKVKTNEVGEGQDFGAMVETKIDIAANDEIEITEKMTGKR